MTVIHVAIIVALLDMGAVFALCVYGDVLSAVGMAAIGVVCIGGGLVAQCESGRTTSTSA